MTQSMRALCGVLLAALLAACGGGGGSAGATSGTGGGSGGSGTTTTAPTVIVSIVDAAGTATTGITVGGSYSARATLKDSTGAAVADRLVTFSLSNTSIATLSPATALSNSAGVAQVAISPASITSIGAATLSASASIGSAVVSGQMDFAVSASSLSLSEIAVGSTSLASGGNTSLSVTALIGGVPSTGVPVNVNFAASCGRINGGGTSFSTATNGSGVASAVYSAVASDGTLCSGPVTLSASSAGATTRTATVNVAAPTANAVTFVSATPAQIFVSGSGALEQSIVKFKALAGSTALPNVGLRFSLLVNPGGVGLNASGATSDVAVTTDASGEASISVFSGTIPGPVKVRASLVSDSSVFAETQNLSVSSGPPSQRFISLSATTYNIEGWNRDGIATTLTARLADRQGNPVENGTVVNFTAEGGQVASSCATSKVNGIASCSVDFISQNPRPSGGRVSILAYASGTKDYTDNNGNNKYDAVTDTLNNIGDAYRDDNENGVYDAGEFVIPRGGLLSCAGAGEPFPSRANTCDSNLATTVRQQSVILFSSSTPLLTVNTNSINLFDFTLASIDNPLLPLPSGTTVSVEMGDTTSNSLQCAVDKLIGSTVENITPTTDTTVSLATTHTVTLKECVAGDIISIKVKVPSGLETTFSRVLQ